MTKPKHPGGRPTLRPVNRKHPVYLFADQLPISSVEVRKAVDAWTKAREGETLTDKTAPNE